MNQLERTKDFWNASPCGGQSNFEERKAQRYRTEPWITAALERITGKHPHILEIGCGQGTDALVASSMMFEGGSYVGVDYSDESIAIARQTIAETATTLRVTPEFYVENAENLSFENSTIECVYSLGVLHHTPNEIKAFDEIYRVLKPGGRAYIWVYRKWSPKVGIAKLLRLLQAGLDGVFGTELCLYKLFHGRHLEGAFGTMILECFGVPYMKWYNEQELRALFSRFHISKVAPIGYNLPWLHNKRDGRTRLGCFWAVELEKEIET